MSESTHKTFHTHLTFAINEIQQLLFFTKKPLTFTLIKNSIVKLCLGFIHLDLTEVQIGRKIMIL